MTIQAVSERKVSPPRAGEALPSGTTVMTGEDLFALGDIGRAELIKGELVRMTPTGHPHGYIEANFAATLHAFVRQHKLGCVLSGEVGVYTQRNPDTVRGADVIFISNERLAQVQSQPTVHGRRYLDVAPELIVEIMSPDDCWRDVNDKLTEYFDIGVQVIWVADPHRRRVYIHRSLTEIEVLGVDDTLSGGEALPGFGVPVAELFE